MNLKLTPNDKSALDEFYRNRELRTLPEADEWFWNLAVEDSETLRAACFYEYVRENEHLLKQIEDIDKCLHKFRCSADCVKSITEQGFFEEFILLESDDLRLGATLIAMVKKLAIEIYPLPPHLLAGRELRARPFFARQPFEFRAESLPPGQLTKKRPVEATANALGDPINFWKAKLHTGYVDGTFEVSDFAGGSGVPCAPPRSLLVADGDKPLAERNVEVLLIAPRLFRGLGSLPKWAGAAFNSRDPMPPELQGKIFRLEATLTRGLGLVAIVKDFDGFKNHTESDDLLFFAAPTFRDLCRGVLAEFNTIAPSSEEQGEKQEESALADNKRMVQKSNREYFLRALCALSAIRMGHVIDADQLDVLIRHKEETPCEQKLMPLPYNVTSTVYGALKEFREYAEEIFPALSPEERQPRTCAIDAPKWTLKQ